MIYFLGIISNISLHMFQKESVKTILPNETRFIKAGPNQIGKARHSIGPINFCKPIFEIICFRFFFFFLRLEKNSSFFLRSVVH